jgi:NADPH-dependent glutamate synthase beta subunit-like oxidoreductase
MPSTVAARPLSVGIVGSGPSALFTAEALLESGRDVEVAIIERLPVPFGLVRFGVAPDHQTTKRVSESMGAILARPMVRFYGNVEVGTDISLPELRSLFDAVVLATGASKDRRLGIAGDNLAHVVGSSAMVGWYNGHPDHATLSPRLSEESAVIIGMGNVALDIARILTKPMAGLAETDIAEHALAALARSNVKEIYIVGRGSPLQAKFSYPELREMQSLEDTLPVTDPLIFPATLAAGASKAQIRIFDLLKTFAANQPNSKSKRVHFVFGARPVEICGKDAVESVMLEERVFGQTRIRNIPCGLVVTAIGYRSTPIAGALFDDSKMIVPNVSGLVDQRLFVVGWIGRGPSGVIGTNKPDAYGVASQILDAVPAPEALVGFTQLERTLLDRGLRWVSHEGWLKIDAIERPFDSGRTKLVDINKMLDAAKLDF